jgi:hypothetical protein
MKSIFEQAEQVIVWLGPAEEQSEMAFKLIHELHDHLHSKDWIMEIFQQADVTKSFEALSRLLKRPYWSRMWVVQEHSWEANCILLW